ncbi:MAG: hypothetical protein ACU85V_09185 [Gammaproteobacteria bacterium]
MTRDQRPLRAVPFAVTGVLVLALAAQLVLASSRTAPAVSVSALPAPPPAAVLELAALGEPGILARLAMLWLQAFDYQPGVSIALADLDYAHLEAWLDALLALDPAFQYPLLSAARVYGEVADPVRQRQMLRFVARRYAEDPARRWPWLAHAVYVARHRLGDQALALDFARRLAAAPAAAPVPGWARQMHIFVLENMGELEAAKVLLGGLLESGEITDLHEQRFLSRRLAELEERSARR